MDNLRLERPSVMLKDEYLEMVVEWMESRESAVPHGLNMNVLNFDKLVATLDGYSYGIGLAEGLVPFTTLWLVGHNNRVLGVVSICHELNDYLRVVGGHIGFGIRPSERLKGYATLALQLALDFAKEIGLRRVLVTCDVDNIASAKTILRNGGVLDSTDVVNGVRIQRYWIELV